MTIKSNLSCHLLKLVVVCYWLTLYFLFADNTKKDSDSTPVKGGTDMGEQKVFASPPTWPPVTALKGKCPLSVQC